MQLMCPSDPMQGKNGPAYETSVLHKGVKERPLTALEMSSIVSHCCTLMHGLVIGSSEKICSGLEQIKQNEDPHGYPRGVWACGDSSALVGIFTV